MEKSSARWWDFPSAVLLVLAILVSSWRLTITNWTPHLEYVSNMAFFGTLVGLALGKSNFGRHAVRGLAIGYTLVIIPWQLMAFYESEIEFTEKLLGVGGRILFSVSQFAANKPVRDELFLVFLLSFLYWIIGTVAGYSLIRKGNFLAAVIPAALAMLITHQYDSSFPNRIWFIAIHMLLSLALLGRHQFVRNREVWARKNILVSPETGSDLSTAALIVASALVLVAWVIPPRISPPLADAWENATESWRTTTDRMGKAFASVESVSGQGDFFKDTLALGKRSNLDKTVIFTVYAPPESLILPRLYWRGRVYDHYENGQWTTSTRLTDSFSPQRDEYAIPEGEHRQEYEFSFKSFIHRQSMLYLPGQPIWVSRPVDAELFELPDDGEDVLVMLAYPFIESGETYHTRSSMANPSITELREAGENYPQWVMDRYLQLPEEFPDRIAGFAQQVTSGLSTPYDKAEAITAVLRAQTEYVSSVEPPTDGRDLIEWFLFDAKKGYCNYYATAEVLMLRSLGIPARVAVGFSQGENDEDRLVYFVRNENAHAWPEVYFPGYGWVEFEPTGNQSPLVRPERPVEDTSEEEVGPAIGENAAPVAPTMIPEEPVGEAGSETGSSLPLNPFPIILWTTAALLLLMGLIFLNIRIPLATRAANYFISVTERRGMQMPQWMHRTALYILLSPIERAYHGINVCLRWLGKTPALHYTPADRAAVLIELVPEAADEIAALQKEYQAYLYSSRAGSRNTARRASRIIIIKTLRTILRQGWTQPWSR
jgi:transglutaminase-like putative cysteine protease